MQQQPAHSIIAELEEAVRGGSSAKRVETLRQVTDLFLNDGDRLSDEQVQVFDDVLCLLIARVETRARAELSKRLAPLDYAPFEVIRHLAWDDEIAVAGDVLTHSSRLGTEALVEIASTKGYSRIVARAEGDDELVEILGLRLDLPIKFLHDLLRRAKDAVRARLMAIAPPALLEEIKRVLNDIVRGEDSPARNFEVAEQLVKLMKKLHELDDAAVFTFAEARKFDEIAAALALLNDAPTEMMARLLEGPRADLVLIPCRSARLNWPTVETILRNRPAPRPIDEPTLKVAERDYRKLSMETAQRTVRFWQLHNRIEK